METSTTLRTHIYNNFKVTLFLLTVLFDSCISGGTHGSIESYKYKVNKYILQKAVENVLATNANIKRDTTKNYMIDVTNGRNDTIISNYYNDGEQYLTINIKTKEGYNDYTIQYLGNKKYWDTAKNAFISIAYAYYKDGNGGSEGNGGIKWYNWGLKRKLLEPFESEFISKVDKELKQKHTYSN